jgi:hypothetical protein
LRIVSLIELSSLPHGTGTRLGVAPNAPERRAAESTAQTLRCSGHPIELVVARAKRQRFDWYGSAASDGRNCCEMSAISTLIPLIVLIMPQ